MLNSIITCIKKYMTQRQATSKGNPLVLTALIVYLLSLIWLLFFYEGQSYSRLAAGSMRVPNFELFRTVRHYLFVLFQTDHGLPVKANAAVNLLGNSILFVPMGILVPWVVPAFSKIKFTFLAILGICLIEFLQWMYQIGIFDIDDIFLNVIGCLTGLFLSQFYKIK